MVPSCYRHRNASGARFCFAARFDLRLALPASLRASAFAFAPSKPHSGKLTCKVFSVFLSLALPARFSLTASDQAVDLLVSASSRIAPLSPPTYLLIVSQGSSYLRTGNLLLEVGFTLRCLQRLSTPHFASQLCRWHDNCCTRDASTPVLSY